MSNNFPDYVCHLDSYQSAVIPKDPTTYNNVLITVTCGSHFTHEGINCVGEVKIFLDKSSSVHFNHLYSQGDIELKVNHNSKVTFTDLTCLNSTLNVMYSSSLIVDKFAGGENANCDINVAFGSVLNIKGGYDLPKPDIYKINGLIDYTSTVICKAKIEVDNVQVDHFSKWET